MFIPDYTSAILRRLEDAGYEAYIVGGCLRDMMLGLTPKDYDIATNARPSEVLALFAGYKTITAGIKHGTVGVVTGGTVTEITTFRSDGEYADHRHPVSVEYSDRIEDDLSRRDFTVNAMAYSPKRGIVDPFGGAEDLKNGILRTVGDPAARFSEDALRILRGVRFASVYGLEPEPATARAMLECACLLSAVAVERISAELFGALAGPYAEKYLHRFKGVLAVVLPELAEMASRQDPVRGDMLKRALYAASVVGDPVWLRLAALLEHVDGRGRKESAELAGEFLRRLRGDRHTRENATKIVGEPEPDDLSRAGIRRLMAKLTPTLAVGRLKLCRASAEAAGEPEKADRYARALEIADDILLSGDCVSLSMLEISGDDLISLGVPPGKKLGKLLMQLFEEVLEGKTENTRHALAARASDLIAKDNIS